MLVIIMMTTTTGVYYCRADNPVGSVTGSVSLIVHGELNHHIDHHMDHIWISKGEVENEHKAKLFWTFFRDPGVLKGLKSVFTLRFELSLGFLNSFHGYLTNPLPQKCRLFDT